MALNLDVAPTLLDYARVTDHPNQRLMLGRSLRRALRHSARMGVDVRLLLPGAHAAEYAPIMLHSATSPSLPLTA